MKPILSPHELETISRFIQTPVLLFNGEKQLCLNDAAAALALSPRALCPLFDEHRKDDLFQSECGLARCSGAARVLRINARLVEFDEDMYFLAEISDISEQSRTLENMRRISTARELMLDISQNLTRIDTIEHIYEYIMENAMKAIKKSRLSSIFAMKDGVFRTVAAAGFDQNLYNICFVPENTFLYMATDGKMDRTANIGDLSKYYSKYYPSAISGGVEVMLRSTLSTPIYINGEIYGMINIDSIENDAFDDDDVKLMDFIRGCVETTLTNRLLYEERVYFSHHDPLTGLYNRAYFEDYFSKLSQEYKASSWIVIFDLNNLKTLNDSYGHIFGDQSIICFAKHVEKALRHSELLSRIGGDELVGLFRASDVNELHERFRAVLQELSAHPVCVGQFSSPLSFSYGCAYFGLDGNDFTELLNAADARMYEFKRRHKAF